MLLFVHLSEPVQELLLMVMAAVCIVLAICLGESIYSRNLLHQDLSIIHKNLHIIMTNEEQAQADITAILGAITTSATAQVAIAQELSDLRNQLAAADVPAALLTQLDDLTTRSASLASGLQSLVPATPATPATPAAAAPTETPATEAPAPETNTPAANPAP